MNKIFLFIYFQISLITQAQLYFPPVNSNTWDTTSPLQLSWCDNTIDSLYQFLDSTDSKAFILLKDGKIVLEKYFNGHDISTDWYWASAGKTLTAFMVGIAQQENFLSISDTSSKYLGSGWTNCTSSQEEAITIWHQLTMTSGLDDLYVALGKNGQSLNVVPSQNIVWLRMGESPYNNPVLANYNNEIWSYINKLNCNSSNINPRDLSNIKLHPNPVENFLHVEGNFSEYFNYSIYNQLGKKIDSGILTNKIDLSAIKTGLYIVEISNLKQHKLIKILKN